MKLFATFFLNLKWFQVLPSQVAVFSSIPKVWPIPWALLEGGTMQFQQVRQALLEYWKGFFFRCISLWLSWVKSTEMAGLLKPFVVCEVLG